MTLIILSAAIRVVVWLLVLILALRYRQPIAVFVSGLVIIVNLLIVGDAGVLSALLGTVASGGLAWLVIDRMQHDERREERLAPSPSRD